MKEKSTNDIINGSDHSFRLFVLLRGAGARKSKLNAIFVKKLCNKLLSNSPPLSH